LLPFTARWGIAVILVFLLGVVTLAEIVGGLSILAAANTVFVEMEGLVMAGSGVLTLAVLAGADVVRAAIKVQRDVT
jgi:hypothetical protein